MGAYLLDTDHLSYFRERHPGVVHRLGTLSAEDQIVTSVINTGELLRGIHLLPKGRRRRELLEWYHRTIPAMVAILPVTQPAAEFFAEIGAALSRKGMPIPSNDVWVAAVALAAGVVLVSHDRRFARVPGLHLEDWTE